MKKLFTIASVLVIMVSLTSFTPSKIGTPIRPSFKNLNCEIGTPIRPSF